MNNCFNEKNNIPQKLPKKNNLKKDNIINSLNEVECFLNNLNSLFTSVKFINILKKFK